MTSTTTPNADRRNAWIADSFTAGYQAALDDEPGQELGRPGGALDDPDFAAGFYAGHRDIGRKADLSISRTERELGFELPQVGNDALLVHLAKRAAERQAQAEEAAHAVIPAAVFDAALARSERMAS